MYEAAHDIGYVYFPTSAAVSLLNVLQEGGAVEVAIVAREGFVGLPILFNQKKAIARAVVQVPGETARIKAEDFAKLKHRLPVLNTYMADYATIFLQQIFIASGCNRFHSLEQRIARWLLDHYDRSPTRPQAFPFTHEFLADMLGAHRTSVTQVTDKLQSQGLIEYRRGKMNVTSPERLATVTCECYHVLKEALDEFIQNMRRQGRSGASAMH